MLIELHNPIFDWLFPKRCLVCDQDMKMGEVCDPCISLISHHEKMPLAIDHHPMALFYYEHTIRELVKNAKYYNQTTSIHVLMKLVENSLRENSIDDTLRSFEAEGITYIPTHWANRLMRGIDLPYLFAMLLSKKIALPILDTLQRTSPNHRQALIKKRTLRRDAVKGSFKLKRNISRYKRILLVDDIVTTGSTFLEAKRVLKPVAQEIRCIAIAKTPS